MQKKIQIFLEKYHMIEPGDHIIAGLSGGADSVCLLLVLKDLQATIDFELTAVHVEHGIRGGESLRDAAFAEKFCREQQIPFLMFSVDAPKKAGESHQTLEEAARELRYDCFNQACRSCGGNKIAVAHHGDDCAETMLFHLSRGTGIRGLCGISPVRDGAVEPAAGEISYPVIRPLLGVVRGEIEQFLMERGQTYCTDSTNDDTSLTRNRIRSKILPELSDINPQTVQHMVRTAGYLEEICDFLDTAAWEAGKEWVICSYERERIQEIRISAEGFTGLHPVLQKNLIHRLLGEIAGSRRDITALHIDAVCSLFKTGVGKSLSLPYGILAKKEYDVVALLRQENMRGLREKNVIEEKTLPIPGETVWNDCLHIRTEIFQYDGKIEKIPQKTYTKWFDYDKIKNTVQLRTRRPGDFFQVDESGGHKKLKNFLIDAKVPQEQRNKIPLLAEGSHILWAVGYRISEAYKVTQKTKRILSICVDGGQNENE